MIDFLIFIATIVGIYGILSLSLNLQYGLTGLSNFGHVAFFMTGAYISAILVTLAGTPIFVGLLGGCAAAGLLGLLTAMPTANLRADYWAIFTLAAAETIRLIFLNENLGGPYTGASFGIGGIPQPLRALFTTETYPIFYIGLVLVFLGLSYLVLHRLTISPFGRVLKAIREGDDLPKALGKDTGRFKMKVMAIAGVVGGLAGSLYAHYITFIDPFAFEVRETFLVWAMVIVGGKGNHLGTIAGALIVHSFYSSTRFFKDFIPLDPQLIASMRMVAIGLLIVVAMLYLQQGLLRERRRTYESLIRGRHAGG